MNQKVIIGLMLLTLQLQAKHIKLELQKALDKKLVKAKVQSLGGYQGYCINMDVRNLSGDSLLVVLEAGRRLNSVNDRFQDILVVKEELIVLRKSEEKSIKVKGYCCQASNCAPGKNTIYNVNKMADSGLVRVARFLNTGCYSAGAEQQAIWAVSDGKPSAGITDKNAEAELALRQLICSIKGETLPWYTVIYGTYVYPSGSIVNYPLVLKGKFKYSQSKAEYATLYVFNAKGEQVCLVRSEWLIPGNNEYVVDIPVKNLESGKYTIALKTDSGELAHQPFEI
jgi:hypothetical protein